MKVIAAVLLAGVGLVSVVVLIAAMALSAYALQFSSESGTFSSIAAAALSLQEHISGSRSNQYDEEDPFMQPVLDYWERVCPGNGPHGICELAESGNLQCVEGVSAAYFLAGDPLPNTHLDAEQFWDAYGQIPGWKQIPSPSADPGAPKVAPSPGDLMVFKGGAHQINGTLVEFGHIGIVVHFHPPSGDTDGSIEMAEANGPGTKFPPLSTHPWIASDRPGNTYVMTVHPDYTIATWGPYTFDGVAYSGLTVLGFLHDTAFAQG